MQAWKTQSRRPSLASINLKYNKTLGHRLRDAIEYTSNLIYPFVKHVFPNFIAIHYFYIIIMTVIGSILMYPVKNYAYIDILFSAAGACTQGGLNTINTNEMTLYQQIVIYLICCLTTPIWIHGGLAFVRLYWFERHFDGIKVWSKKNFKMRRTKTLIQREMTRTATGAQRRPTMKDSHGSRGFTSNTDFQTKLFSGQMVNREENSSLKENYEMNSMNEHEGEQQDNKDVRASSSTGSTKSVEQGDDIPGIKFGALPKPPKSDSHHMPTAAEQFSARRKSEDISPADMFRSIAMLRNQHVVEGKGEDGPALIINGPAERRQEAETKPVSAVHGATTPPASSSHSTNALPPSPAHSGATMLSTTQDSDSVQHIPSNNEAVELSSDSSTAETSKPVQWSPNVNNNSFTPSSIQFQPPPRRIKRRSQGGPKNIKRNRKSIKKFVRPSMLRDRIRRRRNDTNEDGNDADLEPDSTDNESVEPTDIPSHAVADNNSLDDTTETPNLEKVHSNLAVPSRDATGGSKFYKRSNTMEPSNNGNLDLLTKSPSFQKMIYNKWKEDRRRKGGFLRRKSSVISRSSSDFDGANEYPFDESRDRGDTTDDEEAMGDYAGLAFDQAIERPPRLQRMSTNYLSYQPKIGRNSTFVGLNDVQKAELGGVEYRANKLLCKLLLVYYIGFHIMAFVMLLPWITRMKSYVNLLRTDGVSPAWWGFFTSMSAFNDLGITLTPDSMMSFNTAVYPLIVMMWFIVIGNTGFPVFLRFIIWVLFKVSPELSLLKESLGFLLDHPRRCFTLLFPSAPTWWLLFILVALNAIDLILFIVLDINSQVVEGLSSGFKILDGLFQAVSTRTAGFSVLNLSLLHPSIQVSYMLMMYVSVLPLAISIRRTNVYEEQSLGIYHPHDGGSDADDDTESKNMNQSPKSFIGAHLRRQLSFDLWFLFLGLFIICISEGGKIQDPKKPDFTVFQVLFEIVSAYGTVGLSLGYPNTDQSFSAQFNTFSKVIMIFMLVRGRHRGLPYSLDRAIILPSQSLEQRDKIEDMNREGGSGINDPLVAYLRKQSKFAKGHFKSMLRNRSSLAHGEGEGSSLRSEERPPHRKFSNGTNASSPSLRSVVDYQMPASDRVPIHGEISPMSGSPRARSPRASYRNVETELKSRGDDAEEESSRLDEGNSRLSQEAPDAQEEERARILP
ncbi:LAFA_0G05446g1_1 [Lachancea sp. 'fantastica']|nr:LAFA_0G05446g1_1 [Lachancea sp. 'fantastica']